MTSRRWIGLLVGLSLGLARGASAQILPIHDDPQKSAYASPAEWPEHVEGQCWGDFGYGFFKHVHVVALSFPYKVELNGPVTFRAALMAFKVDGKLTPIKGAGITSVIWDATGTTTPPPLVGDPNGLVQWNATVTWDPRLNPETPLRGWSHADLMTRVRFADGRGYDTLLRIPYYSMIDPEADEAPISAGKVGLTTKCPVQIDPVNGVNVDYGTQITSVMAAPTPATSKFPAPTLPILAPLTEPANLRLEGVSYGVGSEMPDAQNEILLDPDFHHDSPGVTLLSEFGNKASFTSTYVLDPTVLPDGKHHLGFKWTQPSQYPNHTMASLVVVHVTKGDVAPPPPPPSCTVGPWTVAQIGEGPFSPWTGISTITRTQPLTVTWQRSVSGTDCPSNLATTSVTASESVGLVPPPQ